MKISNKKILICITGENGSGKSTVTGYLLDSDNYHFAAFAFADMLNEVYREITTHFFSILPREEKNKKRQQIIDLANSIKSVFGDNVFAKKVVDNILDYGSDKLIISDLRFQVEVDELKRLEKSHHIFIFNINKKSDLNFDNLECLQILIKNNFTDELYDNIENALNVVKLVGTNNLLPKQND
jgi:dephospho-CoA kinase